MKKSLGKKSVLMCISSVEIKARVVAKSSGINLTAFC